MCLLTFSFDEHPRYALVFAANRDEFYERPTEPALFWEDHPHVLAGRDLKGGGTWMGVTRSGRWAAVTNYRDPSSYDEDARSRGELVADYLRGSWTPSEYMDQLAGRFDAYNGFNVLVGTPETVLYASNRGGEPQELEAGCYGLSNHLLNTPWPKVERAKQQMARTLRAEHIEPDAVLEWLHDTQEAPEKELPDTGVGADIEKMLSPIFIQGERYGTRASTVLLIDREGRITFVERTFNEGQPRETRRFQFPLRPLPGG